MNSQNSTKSFEFGAIPGLDILNIKNFIQETSKAIQVFDRNNQTYTLFIAEDGDLKWYDGIKKITRVLDSETVIHEGIRLSPESQREMSDFLSPSNGAQTAVDTRDRFNQVIANALTPKPEPKCSKQSPTPCSISNTETDLAYAQALHIGRGGQIPAEIIKLRRKNIKRNRDCGDEN